MTNDELGDKVFKVAALVMDYAPAKKLGEKIKAATFSLTVYYKRHKTLENSKLYNFKNAPATRQICEDVLSYGFDTAYKMYILLAEERVRREQWETSRAFDRRKRARKHKLAVTTYGV